MKFLKNIPRKLHLNITQVKDRIPMPNCKGFQTLLSLPADHTNTLLKSIIMCISEVQQASGFFNVTIHVLTYTPQDVLSICNFQSFIHNPHTF